MRALRSPGKAWLERAVEEEPITGLRNVPGAVDGPDRERGQTEGLAVGDRRAAAEDPIRRPLVVHVGVVEDVRRWIGVVGGLSPIDPRLVLYELPREVRRCRRRSRVGARRRRHGDDIALG